MKALDRAALSALATPGKEGFRAHLALLQQYGAGSWLQALPCEALDLKVDSVLLGVFVKRRLRLPISPAVGHCPQCDGVPDCFGDHARSCPCGGDRTKRHHRLRVVVASRAKTAGLHSEVEKPGLLPPRLDEAGAVEDGVQRGGGRRPADVFIGNWDSAVSVSCIPNLFVLSGSRVSRDYFRDSVV